MRLTAIAAVVIAALIGVGLVLDDVLPEPARAVPGEVAASVAGAGAWYCAAGDTADGSTLATVIASPPSDATLPADVVPSGFREGATLSGDRLQVFSGSDAVVATNPELPAVGLAVRWWDTPAAVTRVWERRTPGVPSGRVEGPCPSAPSDTWVVPGLATAGGAQAVVHLANPFGTDAAVTLTLTTPDGPLEPKLLENVVVPDHSVRTILLNEHAPERADVGVIVRTRSGRVVVEAVQSFNAAIGGIEGLSLAPAAPVAAETWTAPWIQVSDAAAAWAWITNPSDDPAAVTLTLHTEAGGTVPEGLEELTIAPRATARVDLRGLLPEGAREAGVTVRSDNGVPVTASVATQYGGEDQDRTGLAMQIGAPVPATSWILSGGATAGRRTFVDLVNVSGEPVTVDLAVWAGGPLARPDALQGVTVPAGAVSRVEVTEVVGEAPGHSVFVSADGEVVAGLRSFAPEGPIDVVAHLGVPASTWVSGGLAPPTQQAPDLTQRLGTATGPGRASDAPTDG